MDIGLKGKKAVVTGGTHGIGKCVALTLAKEGCSVAVFSRSETNIINMSHELSGITNDYICDTADVFEKESITRFMDHVERKWDGVDIVINNVGGGGRWGSEFIEETNLSIWDDVYYKNAGIATQFTMWAIPYMREKKWGRVVSISSIHGKEGGGKPWFNMAKASEISLMKTLARTPYLARDGITFNTVAPGDIIISDTGWEKEEKEFPEKFSSYVDSHIPAGRMGTPDEVAFIVLCLCSIHSSFVNGACVTVDGGESMSF